MRDLYTIKTMPQAVFGQWIADLQSGKFPQGQDRLFNGTSYCCLGVLNHRINVANANGTYLQDPTSMRENFVVYLDWKNQNILAKMNDEFCTFDQIADYLLEQRNG